MRRTTPSKPDAPNDSPLAGRAHASQNKNKQKQTKGTLGMNGEAKTDTPKIGTQIVVLDRGFVYVGKVSLNGETLTINNARNIRRWGTTKGLGELVDGPTPNTKLDQVGKVIAPMRAVIHLIQCNKDW